MTTLSAGLLKVENLTVTGTQSGAVQASNFNFTNLDLSGNLTVGGDFTAPNLTSNVQIAKDRWHLPTPTGPFAVDIIPVAAQDFNITMDLFGRFSSKYWGTETFPDNAYATIITPSNRTGAAKNVSASLTGCMDSSDPTKTLACGTMLYHPDDFVFQIALGYNYAKYCGDETSGEYIGFIESVNNWADAFYECADYFGGSGINNTDASANRQTLLDLWSVIENTYTYQNLHQHFSVATGKIWHTPQSAIPGNTHGYKNFTKNTATDDILAADGTQMFNTTWTPSELPTQEQIFEATGDNTGCPVVIKMGGTSGNELQCVDVWHSFELASRGFVVIQLGYTPCSMDDPYKIDTNQTVIDCIRNGYLGDQTQFDPTLIPNFTNYTTNKSNSQFNTGDFNNPEKSNTFGIPQEERIPLLYTDENGRTAPTQLESQDRVNITSSLWFKNNLSHIESYNTPQAIEKWFYILKYFATSISGFEERIDFANVSFFGFSMGGAFFSQAQNITNNSGNALYLGNLDTSGHIIDPSGTGVSLFSLNNAALFEGTLINSKQENLGWLYDNRNAPDGQETYNYKYPYRNPGPFIFTNENMCPFEQGFTVPVISICSTGPVLLYADSNISHTTEALQYNLQKTRINNEANSCKCLVYSIGTKHASVFDPTIDFDTTNHTEDTIFPEYPYFFSGGWDWASKKAFPSILYNKGEIETIQTQELNDDIQKTMVYVMWNLHNQCIDPLTQIKGVAISHLMEYGNVGSGKLQIGTDYLESSIHIDGFFRYVGPHKIETIRDPSGNRNHLSLDFGKNTIYENNNNEITIVSREGYTPNFILDGSGASISINGITMTYSKWDYLINTVLSGH